MHTTGLRAADFRLVISGGAGGPADIDDLFPAFDEHDRLGIVLASDNAAAGAATLILATVTAFYDRLRAVGEPFFAYPDFFAFHVGRRRGSLRKLDVYPEHKEVVVPAEPEAVARAVNDRAITRLLVPDGTGRSDAIANETRASAGRRIRTALAYASDGHPADPDVTLARSPNADAFVEQMLEATGAPPTLRGDGQQHFRRVELEAALRLLAPAPH